MPRALLLLLIALCAGLLVLTPASAQNAALPTLPGDYAVERRAGSRWVFPKAADSEVLSLRAAQADVWTRLGAALGVYLAPELDIRIALNPEHMQALAPTGQTLPDYATGVAFPEQGIVLLSLTAPESWLRPNMKRLLVHELAHVALHRATLGREVPRWFSEGVAVGEAEEHSLERVRSLWEATLRGQLIGVRHLAERFPARHGEVNLAYAQAADLVGYMRQGDNGPPRFRKLIAELRTGMTFEQAILSAYHTPLWQIEKQWRTALLQRFGRWPSMLAGLTLLWAISALLLVAGYVRIRRRHRQTLKRWEIEEAPLVEAVQTAPPPPPPQSRHAADDVLDAFSEQRRREPEIPTVVHDGRSHTLH